MSSPISSYSLGAALYEVGLVPDQTARVELHVPADGALMLRYEVYLTGDDIQKLEKALAMVREAAK